MGLCVMIKHKKRVKVFIGNFQFNFRAPMKKPFCATLSRGLTYPLTNKAKKKSIFILGEYSLDFSILLLNECDRHSFMMLQVTFRIRLLILVSQYSFDISVPFP